MATLDLSDACFKQQRVHKHGFFKLPRELRDMIYAYVLIEPYYLSRRHSALCPESDRSCVTPETPPFFFRCASGCYRRHGLNLLRANRQIHDEAAPIFWSKNVHFFPDATTFTENVSQGLRKQCREYLRHVHIVDIGLPRKRYQSFSAIDPMWEAIFLCKNLRTIELNPDYLDYFDYAFSNLRSNLPCLKSVSVTKFNKYDCYREGTEGRHPIWIKITKRIPLHLRAYQLRDAVRNFLTNHLVHVNFQVNKDFIHEQPTQTWAASIHHLAPHLKDNNSVQTVTLRDGAVVDLPIYGLPNSRETRTRHSRQRMFDQNRCKAAGLPNVVEARFAERVKELRKERKERLKAEEQELERALRGLKLDSQREREEDRAKQELAGSKNRKNQHIHKQRKIRKAEKVKQEERKRVPKTS